MQLDDITVATGPVAEAALEVVRTYSAPALVNHCVRSYLFAAALAATDGLAIDHELLYVASMLHDLALEPAFDSHTVAFEVAGGHVAWVFAAGAGWPAARRTRMAEIIVAHMQGADPAADAEGHLLDRATGLDISGRGLERWPAGLPAEIVAAYPRLDLAERFLTCFADQAARKPASSAGEAVRRGLPDRLAANPLDRL